MNGNNIYDDKDRNQSATRRSFLKTASAVGLTVGATGGASAALRSDEVEIPILQRRDEVVKTELVPRKWLEQVRTVENRVKRLATLLEDDSRVRTLGVTAADHGIRGKSAMAVKIRVTGDSIPSAVANVAGDVPVQVETNTDFTLGDGDVSTSSCSPSYNAGDEDPVKGCSEISREPDCYGGTVNATVTYNGTRYALVPRHVVNSDQTGYCRDGTNGTVYQNDEQLGEVVQEWKELDTVLVDNRYSNRSFPSTGQIVGESGYVRGYVTHDGLSSLVGTYVNKRGCATGYGDGKITAYDSYYKSCDGWALRDFIENEINTDYGDSGAPIYTYGTYGNQYMVGQVYDQGWAAPSWKQANYVNFDY